MTQSPKSDIGTGLAELPTKSRAQQQQEELDAAKRQLAQENARFERQQQLQQLKRQQQFNQQRVDVSSKKIVGGCAADNNRGSGGSNNFRPVEVTQSPESDIGTCLAELPTKSRAQQQQEELDAAKRQLAQENAETNAKIEQQQQLKRQQQLNQQTEDVSVKKIVGGCAADNNRGSGGSNNFRPVEVTQSPEPDIGTGLDLKYSIILKQPNRKFALSRDWLNLYIMNLAETDIREYTITSPKPELMWHEEGGNYSNGARMILVSVDNLENPSHCQLKISGMTKTYKFEKIIRIEVQNAFR